MRRALSGNSLFSHRRDSARPVRQNVNVFLPVNDPDLLASNQPTNNIATPTNQAGPIMAESRVLGGRRGSVVKKQKRNNVSIVAKKPNRRPVVLGKKAPAKNAVKDIPVSRTIINKKQKCYFKIPSILLPDPNLSQDTIGLSCPSFLLPVPTLNPDLIDLLVDHWTGMTTPKSRTPVSRLRSQISQIDFEQKCLLPPLRAFVLGGEECQTREHTVYLEWLIYLRQRLFNI